MQQLSARLLPLRLRFTRRTPVRYVAAQSSSPAPRWGRFAGLTVGVTALGLVAGAAIAAPDQFGPLLKLGGQELAALTMPWIESGLDRVGALGAEVVAFVRVSRTPRELAMLVVGVACILLALAATILSVYGTRSASRQSRVGAGGSARDLPVIMSPAARMTTPRRAFTRTTPTEVRTLVERGSSLTDIARRTGMPVDAVRTLLAVADPSGQLPVRIA